MQCLFKIINNILIDIEKYGVTDGRKKLLKNHNVMKRRDYQLEKYHILANGRSLHSMSPLTATETIPTEFLLNYLKKYEDSSYKIGELLKNRSKTLVYKIDALFRGDPYPGVLAAIDYLECRTGATFEEREMNLVLVFGKLEVNEKEKTIRVINNHNPPITINDFTQKVKNSARLNLLVKDYHELNPKDIPRYMMQVRYGSTYSKVKEIRVYSHFSDGILFPDGDLWRDA